MTRHQHPDIACGITHLKNESGNKKKKELALKSSKEEEESETDQGF